MCNSPKDQDKSPYSHSSSPYHNNIPVYYPQNGRSLVIKLQDLSTNNMNEFSGRIYDNSYYGTQQNDFPDNLNRRVPVKRRNSANKKERKRTQSINSAFSLLRQRIAMVPQDTKVSKVRNASLILGVKFYKDFFFVIDKDITFSNTLYCISSKSIKWS